jgi:hypothetical protein
MPQTANGTMHHKSKQLRKGIAQTPGKTGGRADAGVILLTLCVT